MSGGYTRFDEFTFVFIDLEFTSKSKHVRTFQRVQCFVRCCKYIVDLHCEGYITLVTLMGASAYAFEVVCRRNEDINKDDHYVLFRA